MVRVYVCYLISALVSDVTLVSPSRALSLSSLRLSSVENVCSSTSAALSPRRKKVLLGVEVEGGETET